MKTMKIEITLNEEQIQKFNELKTTRQNKTDAELLLQIVDRGIYDISYRTKRNKQQWSEFKSWKEQQRQ